MKKGTLLVVDDNKTVLTALRVLLEQYFKSVILSSTNQLYKTLMKHHPDIVLLDMNFSAGMNAENECLLRLSEIKKFDAELPVVIFTAFADIDLAVNALKQGARDFVVKPWNNAELITTLQSAYSLGQMLKEVKQLREKQDILQKELNEEQKICWGYSEAMRNLRRMIQKAAKTKANVLITGENGTRKKMIAHEIQRLSSRNKESFITANMGIITKPLFENEMFGYVKDAFIYAKTDKVGKFEAADKGVLFLDEIDNLSYPLQGKLVNVLQSRQIMRGGGNTPISLDIRLISATNRNLQKMTQEKKFREDLLLNISTIRIDIPPLRERPEDILQLADFFLKKYAHKYHKGKYSLSDGAIEKLKKYHWPGNVRELQNTMEKTVILSEKKLLQAVDFYLQPIDAKINGSESMALEKAEKILIQNSLKRNRKNMSATAIELGVTRQTLYNKIKKYNIDR
jgi:DNA-binding NtrC family response regulator